MNQLNTQSSTAVLVDVFTPGDAVQVQANQIAQQLAGCAARLMGAAIEFVSKLLRHIGAHLLCAFVAGHASDPEDVKTTQRHGAEVTEQMARNVGCAVQEVHSGSSAPCGVALGGESGLLRHGAWAGRSGGCGALLGGLLGGLVGLCTGWLRFVAALQSGVFQAHHLLPGIRCTTAAPVAHHIGPHTKVAGQIGDAAGL